MKHLLLRGPSSADGPSWRRSVGDIALFALVVFCYALPFYGSRDLFYRDEVRYAAIVLEMIKNDSWIVLTINGAPYFDKTPLFFALLRLTTQLVGSTDPWVFLFFVSLTSAFYLGVVYLFVLSLGFSRTLARVVCLILLTLPFNVIFYLHLRMDLLFSGFILLSLALYYRGMSREQSNPLVPLAGLAAAAATMTKGPFGFLFPLLTVVVFQTVQRRARTLLRGDFILSVAITFLPLVGWFCVLEAQLGHGVVRQVFADQVVKRATSWSQDALLWLYYWLVLPAILLPWLLLPVPAIVRGLNRGKELTVRAWHHWRTPRGTFLACYAGVAWLVLNVTSQKSHKYLFPLVPVAVLALALLYSRLSRQQRRRSLARLHVACGAVVLTSALALLAWTYFIDVAARAHVEEFANLRDLRIFLLLAALAAIVLLAAPLIRGSRQLLVGPVFIVLLLSALQPGSVEELNQVMSPRGLAATIAAIVPAETRLVFYKVYAGSFSYHLRQPHLYVQKGKELSRIRKAAAPGPFYVLTVESVLRDRSDLFRGLDVLARRRVETEDFVLLGHR